MDSQDQLDTQWQEDVRRVQRQQEDSLLKGHRALMNAWNDGKGDAALTESLVVNRGWRIRQDEEYARLYLADIEKIAQGSLSVPAAHMILHDCYRRGWCVDASPATSMQHLEAAIEQGSEEARYYLASYVLQGDEKLAGALVPDPERGLDMLRDLYSSPQYSKVRDWACERAVGYLISNVHIRDVSARDQQMIERYCSNERDISVYCRVPLALFYAGRATGTDYAGEEYLKSRKILINGLNSNFKPTIEVCRAQLGAWGVLPKSAQAPTAATKVGNALAITGVVGGAGVIIFVWAVIGTFLLSVAAMINAVMVPVLLVGAAIVVVIQLLSRRKS